MRTEFVECKSLHFSVFKNNQKMPSAVERSKSYHCLQIQLHCELFSEKLQEKLDLYQKTSFWQQLHCY